MVDSERYKQDCPAWGVAPDTTTAECANCQRQEPAMARTCMDAFDAKALEAASVDAGAIQSTVAEASVEVSDAVQGGDAPLAGETAAPKAKRPRKAAKERTGPTILDAASAAIRSLGGTASVKDMVPAMLAAGWSTGGDPLPVVSSAIVHHIAKAGAAARFAKAAGKGYSLKAAE